MKRDGANESLWQSGKENFTPKNNNYTADVVYDVLIVGGGITGISTALALQKAGQKCIIAEAATLGFGTSSGTTAHLNNFFDTTYQKVIKEWGLDQAKLLAKGAVDAIARIKNNVEELTIDCGFEEKDGYIFAINDKQTKDLEDILQGGKEVSLPFDHVNHSPFPVPYLKVVRIQGQAQFDPIAYIFKLAEAFEKAGGTILQNCRVVDVNKGSILEAETELGMIKAKNVVYATHIPPGVNMLHFRCAPYRSYAIAVKLKNKEYPSAVGYDLCDPYRYYRSQKINGEEYLIAGGEDHKTGHEEFTNAPVRRLESYVRSYFDVESVDFKWSSQYYESTDGLPFIGHLPGSPDNMYVATGFGGNGMIYGTLSATIITDLILSGESPYKNLFSPSRLKPAAGFHNFVKEAADVVKEFVAGKFAAENIELIADIAAGEGKLVEYENTKIALFKDENHKVHAVNPTCTHVKCTVAWNETEQSWDCPCHGARFSVDGVVLNGPADKDLPNINLLAS